MVAPSTQTYQLLPPPPSTAGAWSRDLVRLNHRPAICTGNKNFSSVKYKAVKLFQSRSYLKKTEVETQLKVCTAVGVTESSGGRGLAVGGA